MERTISASNSFDAKYKYRLDVDTLKLSSGDIMLGEDLKTNEMAAMFQRIIGIMASAVGNHEFDLQDKIGPILPLAKYDLLAANVKVDPKNPWASVIKSSVVKEKNGHQYGIIGVSPIDLFTRSKEGVVKKDIAVSDAVQTVSQIQAEVEKLQKQGINKIILLSHLGYKIDTIIAKQTQGIDVILGGHSHDLLFDVIENKNLFYSKTGEPVVITQAGRDGKNFGELDIEFDQDGIIKKVQNNIGFTKAFRRYAPAQYVFDKISGDKEIYGQVKSAPPPLAKDLIEPNPHAYFIADCIKKDMGCDIAIVPSANIRGFFESGKVDNRILNDILPFKNKLYVIKYSEQDIVDAMKVAAKSFVNDANKPGIFYASGLKYTISNKGRIISMSYIDNNGNTIPIDVENPRTDRFYTTVINDYCAQGNDGFVSLCKPNQIIEKCPYDAIKCVADVLKKTKDPVDIYDDGRIQIVPE
jgi:5'-nucleotidase